ncbi:MAG: hypothetical protein ACR2F8_07200 [Caulobacteraceae bacterium]
MPSVRARIAAGDLVTARQLYPVLLRELGPIADVLLTGAMLDEADGRLEAALTTLEAMFVAGPRSIHARALAARILWRLDRAEEAQATALAALALDTGNLMSLGVLADIYAEAGRTDDRLNVAFQLALSPAASGLAAWGAVGDLVAGERWEDILQVLDRRDDLPAGRRPEITRAEALLALGRQPEALACLLEALAKGGARPKELVDRLLDRKALTAAALFHEGAVEKGHPIAGARAKTISAAKRICAATTLESAPLAHADAARALEILCPSQKWRHRAVTMIAASLVKTARAYLERGEGALAADHLIQADRLRPDDLAILGPLAEAAAKAGRLDRQLETLARIDRLSDTASDRMAAVDGARAAGRWDLVAKFMSQPPVAKGAAEAAAAATRLVANLAARLETLARDGEVEESLAMVLALVPWIAVSGWPRGAIPRLLGAGKRRLRASRSSADHASMIRLADALLAVDPADAEVGHLAARLDLRFRRFDEAAARLAGVLARDPHGARDWIDLAVACDELGQEGRRDACVARALVIAPTMPLPPPLDVVGTRIMAGSP